MGAVFASRLPLVLSRFLHNAVEIVVALGGQAVAEEIDAYLEIAKSAGVNGAAIFTGHTLKPYLPEVKQGKHFEKFEAGLKPATW